VARFLAGAAEPKRLPRLRYPEIAFAGRSNVGKSSLLNRLVGQRGLARVSKTPGRTQQINFFLIDDRLTFVDLPGYGFARVPLAVQQRWKSLVESYLAGRQAPRAVVVLVDLRRGIAPDDSQLLTYLEAQHIPAIVVGTKADKLGRGERLQALRALAAAAPARTRCIACSTSTGEGIDDLWAAIERHVDAVG
jgi:GTP-binding protein